MKLEILKETENLLLLTRNGKLELNLKQSTHQIFIGNPKSLESGARCMERLEIYPANLKSYLKAL